MWTTNTAFNTTVSAKWILSGEHSVLRGKPALAFPHSEFKLSLSYRSDSSSQIPDACKVLLERAIKWLHEKNIAHHITSPAGAMTIDSTIPTAAGFGSSAALCVAVARFAFWMAQKEEPSSEKVIALATHLEDVFHGKSSGLDVSVIAIHQPLFYQAQKPLEFLNLS